MYEKHSKYKLTSKKNAAFAYIRLKDSYVKHATCILE